MTHYAYYIIIGIFGIYSIIYRFFYHFTNLLSCVYVCEIDECKDKKNNNMTGYLQIDLHSLEKVNEKLMEILNMPKTLLQMYTSKPYITEVEQCILEKASEAYYTENFVTAYIYYEKFSQYNNEDDNVINNNSEEAQLNVIIQYLLCKCLLKSKKFTDLLKAQNILLQLVKSLGFKYPMIYYLLGEFYVKIFCFGDAERIVNEGLAILNDKNLNILTCYVPITNEIIYESTIQGLSIQLLKLKEQCACWYPPDAICFIQNCRENSTFHVAGRNIYFNSPAFNGMVTITCNNINPCHIQFHLVCWKVQKKLLSSRQKVSNTDFLYWKCFTPNCFNHDDVSSCIKKIEILTVDKSVKIIEVPSEEQDQIQNTSCSGARKKKVKSHESEKNKSECKLSSTEKLTLNVPKKYENEHYKIDTLSEKLSKLISLRKTYNFCIKEDNDWRPDKKYYGNLKFHKKYDDIPLVPDCSDDSKKITQIKLFIYSYFYQFISKNEPVRTAILKKKWHEAINLISDCDSLLHECKYANVMEFLLQSLKFVIIGDYICTPGSMPATYTLVKNNICTTLRYLMNNTTDTENENLEKNIKTNTADRNKTIINNYLHESIYVGNITSSTLTTENNILLEKFENNDEYTGNITKGSIDIQNNILSQPQTPITLNNNETPVNTTATNINAHETIKSLQKQLETAHNDLKTMNIQLMDMKMTALRTHLDSQYLIANSYIKTLMMNCQKDYNIIRIIQNILIQSGIVPLKFESEEWLIPLKELETMNETVQKNYNEILSEISCRERCQDIEDIHFSIPQNQLKLPNHDILALLEIGFKTYKMGLLNSLMPSPLHPNPYPPLVNSNLPVFVPTYVNYGRFPCFTPPAPPHTWLPTNPSMNTPMQKTPNLNINGVLDKSEEIKHPPLSEFKKTLKTVEVQVEDEKADLISTLNDENKLNNTSNTNKLDKIHICSIDIIMDLLRSRNRGVLEYDLLWSVQKVRKEHNNSLTRMPLSTIMNEAEQWLISREKIQLSDYSVTMNLNDPQENMTRLPKQYETSTSSTSFYMSENSTKTKTTVKKNPWRKIPNESSLHNANYEQNECVICYEPLNRNTVKSNIYKLKCNHIFHKKCIERWFKEDRTCPTCRNCSFIDTEYPPL